MMATLPIARRALPALALAILLVTLSACDREERDMQNVGTLTLPGDGQVSAEVEIGEEGRLTVNLRGPTTTSDGSGNEAGDEFAPPYLVCLVLDPPTVDDSPPLPALPSVDRETVRRTLDEVYAAYPDPSPDWADRQALCRQFLRFGRVRFSLHDIDSGALMGEVSRPSGGTLVPYGSKGSFDAAYFHGLEPESRVLLTVRSQASTGVPDSIGADFDVRYRVR